MKKRLKNFHTHPQCAFVTPQANVENFRAEKRGSHLLKNTDCNLLMCRKPAPAARGEKAGGRRGLHTGIDVAGDVADGGGHVRLGVEQLFHLTDFFVRHFLEVGEVKTQRVGRNV